MNRRQFCASAASALTLTAFARPNTLAQTGNPGDPMTGDDPMLAAEHLSSLESITHIPALYELYEYIHPDAAAVVPRGTVIGWYQADFQPLGPMPATATGVTWLDSWTWDVTGQSYTDVAEVSFTQEFTNGETVNDVVRLKFDDGAWRWWFGRDAAFVEEQIHRFSLTENTTQEGDAPFDLDNVTAVDEELVGYLPELIYDEETDGQYKLSPSSWTLEQDGLENPQQILMYQPTHESEFSLGGVYFGSIVDSTTDEEDLLRFADVAQNAPPVEFVGWNASPERGPAWLHTESGGADVMGPAHTMTLVMNGNYLRIVIFSESALQKICESIGRDYEVQM